MEPGEGIPPSKTMDNVEYDAFKGVPQSHGFPPAVIWFAIVCLVFIFGVGAWTIYDSPCGHVWPATDAVSISLEPASPAHKPGPFGECYSH